MIPLQLSSGVRHPSASANVQTSELRLTLAEYDPAPTPQFDTHYHWSASLESLGFGGTATFITSGPEFEALLERLETLDATLIVPAEWQSGEGDAAPFRLRLRPNGHTGRLVVEVSLADPVGETGASTQGYRRIRHHAEHSSSVHPLASSRAGSPRRRCGGESRRGSRSGCLNER
jgi:hypothetical protein